MLIFVFICKEMREWGAIWAAVGGILSDFSRVFLGRKGIFGGNLARRWNLEGRFGARERPDRALRALAS